MMMFGIHYVTNKIFELSQLFVAGVYSEGRHKEFQFQDDRKGSIMTNSLRSIGNGPVYRSSQISQGPVVYSSLSCVLILLGITLVLEGDYFETITRTSQTR